MTEDFAPIIQLFLLATLARVNMAKFNDSTLLATYILYAQAGLLQLIQYAVKHKNLSLCLGMVNSEALISAEIKAFINEYFSPLENNKELWGENMEPVVRYKEKNGAKS